MTDNEIIELLNECDTTHVKIQCVESMLSDTRDVIHLDLSKIVDILNRQKAELERLNKQLEEFKFLESRVNSIKNTHKDTFSGALINMAESVARYEAVKEFVERLKKEASEKVGIDEDFLYYDFENKFKTFDSVADVIEFLSAIVIKEMVGENNG